ncbi:hypothetical protein KGF56_001577 [Candida oxycetoniae]|uniref:Rad4 beta-hairpin domain-containing protein n=1 Tax=Candida oxycetoniae TaxID=497107 RepID=A0AAI9WZ05_9ASCO|nr:uncharacterized protein KGF56_001577 [Candida oxycetoniae]KAI3405559.2 hypothetical protein KGF56_001577 [Candida oxycetoniae]
MGGLFLTEDCGDELQDELQQVKEPVLKKRKIKQFADRDFGAANSETKEFANKGLAAIDSDSDSDSFSDSDWENVVFQPVTPIQQEWHESFNITLRSDDDDEEERKKKKKLKELILQKRQRISLQNLSIVSYILNAQHRNKLLSHKKVLKTLKHLLPKQLIKYYRNFNRSTTATATAAAAATEREQDQDKLLIYILKYLIKWFRKNFKHDSNGLRVLGYLPKRGSSNGSAAKLEDYFVNNAKPITNANELCKIIKRFQHNRDTGAQLFTALLRSLGLEARLVYSVPLLSTGKPIKFQPKLNKDIIRVNKDNDLLYPYFWTELVNPLNQSEVIVIETQCFLEEERQLIRLNRFDGKIENSYTGQYYPAQSQLCQMSMHYVLALSNNNAIIDVSSRYMKDISYRWFGKLDLRTESGRLALLMQSVLRIMNKDKTYTRYDNLELDGLRALAMHNYIIPKTFSAMKKSPNFVTPSTLRYNEVITPGIEPVKRIKLDGNGRTKEPVYFKKYVMVGKSDKQWKFFGRSIKLEEVDKPIKLTKATPRTIYNKRVFNQNQIYNPELNDVRLAGLAAAQY